MDTQTITCPNCGTEIEVAKVLSDQISAQLRKQFENEAKRKESALKKKEAQLLEERKKLEDEKESMELKVQEILLKEKAKIKAEAIKDAEKKMSIEFKDLQEQAKAQQKKLEEFQKQELELRKKVREAEEIKRNAELEIARRVDEEKNKAILEAKRQFEEEHRLKDKDKDQKIEDLKKTVEALKQKMEEGSQERRGEVFEQDLEERLNREFPIDTITPIAKGQRGADVVQVVNENGYICGKILWEAKRTKNWSNNWIEKLRQDQQNEKADIAIIVSNALPKDIDSFGQIDGIWVTDDRNALNLASVLRVNLIQLAYVRRSSEGKDEKINILYNYLSSPEFAQRVESLVRSFKAMKDELEQEKRSITKQWAKREKHIELAIQNTSRMFGEIEAIIGNALPEIKLLELPGNGNAEEDEDY